MAEPKEPPDPPMEPFAGTERWIESGPSAIIDNPDLATLIVRLGLVINAMSAQFEAGAAARQRGPARRTRDILSALVTSAAVTNEAIALASTNMKVLRPLALAAGAKPDLLTRIGKLCAGKHAAAQILKRARNEIGFHWDEAVIGASVREYGKNKKIVWVESDRAGRAVHRLAVDVLAHALIPEASAHSDEQKKSEAAGAELAHVDDAMNLVIELFTASFYGYMGACRAVSQEKPAAPGAPNRRKKQRAKRR